jgi:hypothetical protein
MAQCAGNVGEGYDSKIISRYCGVVPLVVVEPDAPVVVTPAAGWLWAAVVYEYTV